MHPSQRDFKAAIQDWQTLCDVKVDAAKVQLVNGFDLRAGTNIISKNHGECPLSAGFRHTALPKVVATHQALQKVVATHRASHNKLRSKSGVVELPFVVWIFLFVLTFPLINLATIGLRLTFLYSAAHTACLRACRGQTFMTAVENNPSCVMLANKAVQDVTQKFTGIHVSKITTQILTTSIDTGIQSRTVSPLTKPADVSKNTYQIEVVLDCSADPFLPIPSPVQIAGLSAPLQLTLSDRQYCESPDGLNL